MQRDIEAKIHAACRWGRFRSGRIAVWVLVAGFLGVLLIAALSANLLTSRTTPELLQEGLQQLERKHYRTVIQTIDELRLRDGEDATMSADLLQGLLDVERQRFRQAIDGLAGAREYSATGSKAWLGTGQALFGLDRRMEAERALLVALDQDPDEVEAHRILAVIYYDLGSMDAALKHLEAVGRLDPTDPRPWRLTGLIMKDYERFPEAIEAYEIALDRTTAITLGEEISVELAECHMHLHQYADAKAVLDQLQKTPQIAALQARCAFVDGRFAQAEALAREAVTADRSLLEAQKVLADICLRNEDPAKAVPILQQILTSDYGDLETRNKLCQALRQLGDTEEADAQLELLTKLGDARKKWAELHKEALQETQNADLRYNLGQLAVELKHRELALNWFRAALTIDPEHTEARQAITELLSNATE